MLGTYSAGGVDQPVKKEEVDKFTEPQVQEKLLAWYKADQRQDLVTCRKLIEELSQMVGRNIKKSELLGEYSKFQQEGMPGFEGSSRGQGPGKRAVRLG